MVTIDRVNSDYTVFLNSSTAQWEGRCNKCGGTDASSNATLATVLAEVITLLPSGGTIYLKAAALPGGLTYGSIILIIVDYQGIRKFYSNNAQIGEVGANDYQTTATGITAFSPSGSAFNGRVVIVYSSHAVDGGIAIFAYANSAWHYVVIT